MGHHGPETLFTINTFCGTTATGTSGATKKYEYYEYHIVPRSTTSLVQDYRRFLLCFHPFESETTVLKGHGECQEKHMHA